jgi:hypothetical protein
MNLWATPDHRKAIMAAFFSGTEEFLLAILPHSRSMDTETLAGEIIGRLEDA